MFSGIIETIGKIIAINLIDGCKQFVIQPAIEFDYLIIGDSIAVNGICLTITEFDATIFKATAVPETLRVTNLNFLKINDTVNLERSLKLNARIGGHYVQGHVDSIEKILAIDMDQSNAWLVKISLSAKLAHYLIPKGYITLDGMSITIIEVADNYFTITLIPHTQDVTISKNYRIGSVINIEVDMMGKYIENFIQHHHVTAER